MDYTEPSSAPPPLWVLIAFPAGLFLAVQLINLIIAFAGGWRGIARRFPGPREQPRGPTFRESIYIAPLTFYRGVDVTLGRDGLHLRSIPLFRLGHPPILIPWSYVSNLRNRGFPWGGWFVTVENGFYIEVNLPEYADTWISKSSS